MSEWKSGDTIAKLDKLKAEKGDDYSVLVAAMAVISPHIMKNASLAIAPDIASAFSIIFISAAVGVGVDTHELLADVQNVLED